MPSSPTRPEHCLQVNLCYLRVGGLLPEATKTKKGLMTPEEHIKISQYISSNKLIQLTDYEGYSTLLFIRVDNATGLYCASGNWGNLSTLTKLSGPLNNSHFNAYRGVNGKLYVKAVSGKNLEVTSIGSNRNFFFAESDIDVSTLIEL